MLKRLSRVPHKDRFSVGSKSLTLDPTWSRLPVSEIEEALLRRAAFPEHATSLWLNEPTFVMADPSIGGRHGAHEDLAIRVANCAERMKIPFTTIGHHSSAAFGGAGFEHCVHHMADMDDEAFAASFANLRERLGWILNGMRHTPNKHLFLPLADATTFAIVIDLVAKIPEDERPFVHIAVNWMDGALPNAERIGAIDKLTGAVAALNAERATTVVYGWSRRVAHTLSDALGMPVQTLDPPLELSLATKTGEVPSAFTVGFLGTPRRSKGFLRLPAIIKAHNRSAPGPRRTHFLVQLAEDLAAPGDKACVAAVLEELRSTPERNVTIIDTPLSREAFFTTLQDMDGLVLPYCGDTYADRPSSAALHALAAGKMVFTMEGVHFAHAAKGRIVAARDERMLGELIYDAASDPLTVRSGSAAAKSAFWANVRPSRLFAQLLYGPTILAKGAALEGR
ncbi:MAG: hypothetical protein AAGD34_04175 [Pseudomonadota bacterium]